MKLTRSWCALIVLLFPFFSCKQESKKETLIGYYQLREQPVKVTSIQDKLDVPWEIKYDNGSIWYSLQKGEIWRTNLETGATHKVLTVADVFRLRTMGALGMAVDHSGDSIHVYLVFNQRTDTTKLDSSVLVTKLVRYTYDAQQDTLGQPTTMLQWMANTGHNGSRVLIGNKNDLYVTTGDISGFMVAQDLKSLNGKVLHLMKDGTVPASNPFKNSYVWSYGHRNQQGICFGENGLLYASEHGDALDDEVNLIEPSRNYGWPVVEGKLDMPEEKHKVDSLKLTVTEPMISWTPTIAPAAIVYYGKGPIKDFQNSLLLVTLKGSALYAIHLDESGRKVTGHDIYFKNTWGRLRSICVDDKGQVYLGTSNRDWNPSAGYPKPGDDHILKITAANSNDIDKSQLKEAHTKAEAATGDKGRELFLNYCSGCHKPGGEGLAGNFPPLKNNPTLLNSEKLVNILTHGRNGDQKIMGATYSQSMPAFSFLTDEQMLDLLNFMKTQLVKDKPLYLAELKELRLKAKD
ncbi:cytochrome c class I [Niastella koreensis GR20-10]|uniref:Cytochrome c class I n=1 Tax=Niastella koreensis (strain DSM 17620 / KACC 11465 / NBRC 106392 / GR20-10) TaxID=700598 RepID=G8T746_NIAKG|nr:PQQ-dependent sugar dehydrogenase [Niastella koreensis]AEW00071.1 cytochrome c class I [Niastella koreensis GR20-10]